MREREPFFDRTTMGHISFVVIALGIGCLWFASWVVYSPVKQGEAIEMFAVGKLFLALGLGIRIGRAPES